MRELVDIWVSVQTWIFQTFVGPVIFQFGLMEWFEAAFNAVEFVMLGVVPVQAKRAATAVAPEPAADTTVVRESSPLPLDALARLFDRVSLVDAVHPWPARLAAHSIRMISG